MIKKALNYITVRFRKRLNEEIWLEDYIKLGMKVGKNVSIQPGVVFDYSHCWLIKIGNNVTIAPHAYLLAHDATTKSIVGYTKVGSVNIEDDVFIGARAIIMPGVTVGKGSIVAAGSIVTKSVPENSVVAGNPAKVIMTVDEYMAKIKEAFDSSQIYGVDYTLAGNVTDEKKKKMYESLNNEIGFVV